MTSLVPTPSLLEFALYRILGNSLPPRHGADEMLAHLRFTLEHEPELPGCRKHWVLNRIADARVEAACAELIRQAGHECIRLPFEMIHYAKRFNDVSDLPPGVDRVDPNHSQIAFDTSSFALEWKYRHKNLYAIGLNEARNVALDAGRAIARWTLPWDAACFICSDAWEQIRGLAASDAAALHLVVSLARVRDNAALLRPGSVSASLTEPQLGFRNDSQSRFDERLRYGNLNKAALLRNLGVPGPWHAWRTAAWDTQPTAVNPERGRFVQGGWVARLASTSEERIESSEIVRWRSRFEGVETLCRQLDARLVAANNPPGRLLCYDEAALIRGDRRPQAAALVAHARAALARPLPSVRDKTGCAHSGDPADYLSVAPYFHIDAAGTVRHLDGQRNDAATRGTMASLTNDRAALDQLVTDACSTALAGTLTGDRTFLEHTARMLRAWFIASGTRMNPHMRFAQVTPGRETGNAWGIVDFRGFWPLLDAIVLTSRAGLLSDDEQGTLKSWFEAFLVDVDTRGIGREPNNIAVWNDLVVAALAAFVGRHARAAEVLADLPLRFASQLSAFGVPVNELKRTRPLHYGLFLAQGLINSAWLGRRLGIDLWAYSASQHRSIAMLLRFLALNKRLLVDYTADADRFDQRLAMAFAQVPADAVHAQALAELRAASDKRACLDGDDMSTGTMPFFIPMRAP
ncbi:alginate lyase family protein [Povalibacter sp.]|uniref:alginate lyase family protein n=1 Tax=Povalibacter sp. TaxID=1962978 RepID=UPI002F406FEC